MYLVRQGEVGFARAIDGRAAPVSGGAPAANQPFQVIGLAAMDVNNGQVVPIVSDGVITRQDWTVITGAALLEVGRRYYLSPATSGKLTLDCPNAPGEYVVQIGRASSTFQLDIEIDTLARL